MDFARIQRQQLITFIKRSMIIIINLDIQNRFIIQFQIVSNKLLFDKQIQDGIIKNKIYLHSLLTRHNKLICNMMCFELKIVLFIALFFYSLNSQITSGVDYGAVDSITIGKADVINMLSKNSQGWISYSINYIKTLTDLGAQQAVISFINFNSYSSNQFSFNTTIDQVTTSSLQMRTKVIGNSYFTLISIQYMVVTHLTITPHLLSNCFLCSGHLVGNHGQRSVTFNQINLLSTLPDRFQVISFISGLKMYNNYQTQKFVEVDSQIRKGQSFIFHTVRTKGKTQIQWVCMSTIIVDRSQKQIFNLQSGVYVYGNAKIKYNNSTLDQLQVTEDFSQVDLMYFGISQIQIGSGKQNQKFIFHSERGINYKNDAQVESFGGVVSYFFVANQACLNTSTPYFNYQDRLCYDTCPQKTYKQDSPTKNCHKCHQSCLTCSGKQENQCLTCKLTNLRTVNGTSCQCSLGYFDYGVQKCQKCQNYIEYCTSCNSSDLCISCDFGLQFNTVQKKCICLNGQYFVQTSKVCLPFPGCILVNSSGGGLQCQACDSVSHFTKFGLNNTVCICESMYTLSQDKCLPKCGDGINFIPNDAVNCDDGNLLNNDGCDANCLVQDFYKCKNQKNSISVCSPIIQFTVQYIYNQRRQDQNSVNLIFQVKPKVSAFSQQDFIFLVSTTIPNQKVQVSYQFNDSLLKIKLFYTQTIQATTHQIQISFDQKKISSHQKNMRLFLKGSNLQLTYDQNISLRKPLKITSMVTGGLISAAFLFLCFFEQMMAATQLLLSSQMVLFAIFSAGNNAALVSLHGLKYLAGFNYINPFYLNSNNYQVSWILPMQSFKQFIFNFNIMVILQVLSILLMVPFKLRLRWLQTQKTKVLNYEHQISNRQDQKPPPTIEQMKQKICQSQIVFQRYKNCIYYPVSLICLMPSVFYFSVQSHATNINNEWQASHIWSIGVSFLSLTLSLSFLVYLYEESGKKKLTFVFFRKAILYPFHLIFIYFGATCLYSFCMRYGFQLYLITGFSIVFLAFRTFNKPYPKWIKIQSIDSLSKKIITILCLALLLISKQSSTSAEIIYLVVLGLLLLSLVLSIVRYSHATFCRTRNNATKINLLNQSQEQGSQKGLNKEGQQSQQQNREDQQSQSENQNEVKIQNKNYNQKQDLNQKGEPIPQIGVGTQDTNQPKMAFPFSGRIQKLKQIGMTSGFQQHDQENQEQSQLTRIKKKLRADLKQKRGVFNQSARNMIKRQKV